MLALLVVCCIIIYGMVMIFLPRNYHTQLEGQVTADFYDLVEILERNGWEASSDSLMEFSMMNNASVEINDDYGNNLFSVNFADMENMDTSAPSMSCSATFRQNGQTYHLFANAALVAVAQSYDILLKLIPLITAVILLISIIGAVICSRYYSKPLVGISNVAKRMTTLDMTWKCDVRRKDEIGVLASSLNEMSQQLSNALDSLQAANEQLQQDIEREREQEKQRVDFFTSVSHELKNPHCHHQGAAGGMIHQVGPYKDRDTYLCRCLKTTNDMEALVRRSYRRPGWAAATSTWNARTWTSAKCCKKGLPAVPWPDGGQGDGTAAWTSSRPSTMRAMAAHGEGVYQCDRKRRGYSPVGATVTVSLQNGNFLCREFRHPHCRGRFEADLHAILPGGQVKKPEQGRQRPNCISPEPSRLLTKSSTTWLQYGKWREVYGVLMVMATILLFKKRRMRISWKRYTGALL